MPYADDDSLASSSSSSTDSDDEFLTVTGHHAGGSGAGGGPGGVGGTAADREAMVRKKLLESFYGAAVSAVVTGDDKGGPGGGANAAGRHRKGGDDGDASTEGASAASSTAGGGRGGSAAAASAPTSNDLDSPAFSATLHTNRHIRSSNVKTLLEEDESLALDIRSLDSTMQTLVYENYSKFIDATDAVRSIGRSVDTSEGGLARLATGIVQIESITKNVDDALRQSRSEVAEKLRLRRLLTRLDALLKLPTTLRTHIESGHTRLAARSHLNATAILGQHSAGFESLKSIEVECNAILRTMIKDLRIRLVHWSGAARVGGELFDRARELLEEAEEDGKDDDSMDDGDDDDEDLENYRLSSGPANPNSVAEIFECAGTLVMFSTAKRKVDDDIDNINNEDDVNDPIMADASASSGNDTPSEFDSGLTIAECKRLALEACGRHLERVLDTHHMDLSERAIDDKVRSPAAASAPSSAGPLDVLNEQPEESNLGGKYLIPSACLDGILEAASLFGLTFGKGSTAGGAAPVAAAMQNDADRALLGGFITESFATFLGHVRAVLLEKSVQGERERKAAAAERAASLPDGMADAYQDLEDEDDGEAYAKIADALGHLLQSVREVASGLALPEVGLDVEAASGLVDQTVEMTEGMVRRRVTRRFRSLRVRVIKDCIVPFARDAISQHAMEEGVEIAADDEAGAGSDGDGGETNGDAMAAGDAEEEKEAGGDDADDAIAEAARVAQMVQRASVALSDGMQLFDDTARAILTRASVGEGPSAPVDTGMIKSAVEKNARRFAVWLALVLEIVAGCDCSDPKRLLDLRPAKKVQADDDVPAPAPVVIDAEVLREDSDFAAGFDDEDEEDRAMTLLYDLVDELDYEATNDARYDLTLAICEMCRLAERSVGENMSQSIASSVAEENKAVIKANSFFGEGPAPSSRTNSKTDVDTDNLIKRRFLAAASRILQLYAMERGAQAADAACANLYTVATTQSDALPSSPSESALNILETAKIASIECANIFGGDRMANPVAPFPDADTDAIGMSHIKARSGSPMKGLQLDVERMFIESVEIFPHSMHMMEFTRNAVVATVLKVAFKSMIEQSRFCSFTPYGYKQMQVDCAFLRHMVLHYVADDKMADGSNGCKNLYNLLSDVMLNVGDRCSERECVGQEEYYDEGRGGLLTPLSIAGSIMERDSEITAKFVIAEA